MSRAISNRFPHRITPLPWLSRKSGLTLVKREGPRAVRTENTELKSKVDGHSEEYQRWIGENDRQANEYNRQAKLENPAVICTNVTSTIPFAPVLENN